MTDFLSFYTGKTVLVTGHTGFKGSWLCLWLQMLGAKVVGYALDPRDNDDFFLCARVGESMADHRDDVRNLDRLLSVFNKYAPELVFHLAAQPIVREGYREPKDTFDVNVGGTVNVLEACRSSSSVKSIVIVTSDKCYLNKGRSSPYREGDRLGGMDPYSASKACAELVTLAYHRSFFRKNTPGERIPGLATARAGNVIGGGDWAMDRIVPDCIRSLRADRPIVVRNPGHTRPWQFVLEPLAGYLMLGAALEKAPARFSGAWNFGPGSGETVPVRDLVDRIIMIYGRGSFVVSDLAGQPKESLFLALDASKSMKMLGWRPALCLDQAVRMTVEWYLQGEAVRDLREFSIGQITAYMKIMQEKNGDL